MKVTIHDCMQLACLAGAKTLAGKSKLERPVRSVCVPENPTPDAIAKESEKDCLVLSTFHAIRGDKEAQAAAVIAMAAAGCAGLVLFDVGATLKEVPREVWEVADAAGMPLLAVPCDSKVTLTDAIGQIMERLLADNEKTVSDALINNTIYHLLNFEKYNSFQSALKGAALANDFQLILLSSDFNPIFSVETRHRTTIDAAIQLGKEKSLSAGAQAYTLINVNGVITYWGPVTIQGETHYMFIVDNEDSYSAAEITKLAEIIELAMGMWKYTPERDVRTEFINALRRGNSSLAYSLQDEVDIKASQIVSVFFFRGDEKGAAEQAAKALQKEEGIKTLYVTEDNEVYGLVIGEGEEARKACLSNYNSHRGESGVRLYHITGIDGIEGACNAYRLIGETMNFAHNVFPGKAVFTRYELSLVSNCIEIQLSGGHVRKNYMDFFDPFRKLGQNKRTQLMDTLEIFVLDAGMNSAKTATIMGIHTNTVQYRLRKIDDILGAEITGNRIIPGLTIALALLRLERVVAQ